MSPAPFDSRGAKVLNGAVSQFDRVRGAPAPDLFPVDGRSLAQLVAFGARFGALVTFYDLSDTANGDWAAFFAADPSIALAVRGALDLPEIERALRIALAQAQRARDAEERHRHQHRAKHVIVRLILILDETVSTDDDVDAQLVLFATRPRKGPLGTPLRDWHHHHRRRPANDDRDWHRRHIELLEDLVAALIGALERGATSALAAFETSLQSPDHPPQAALWNTFAMLFDEARLAMNRFPVRLLDFYYYRVLRQHERAAQPDALFLTFTLAQNAIEAAVARDTLFLAGTDTQGETITYAATSSLEVRPATVTGFGVHRVPYSSDAADAEPIGVLTGIVPIAADGSFLPFPLFGSSDVGTHGGLTMIPASIGFVIESPTLLLAGGERTVTIALNPPPRPSPIALEESVVSKSLNPFSFVTLPTGRMLAATTAPTIVTAFRLYYSTPGGWVKVEQPAMHLSTDTAGQTQTVGIGFTLPAGAPPLAPASVKPLPNALPPTLPAAAYKDLTERPTVVVALFEEDEATEAGMGDTAVSTNIYALLATMMVDSIDVAVNVAGFVPPILSSPSGKIDPSQSFAPFGLIPAQYSALEFTAPEFFVKSITHLTATIGWAGLPVTTTGFEGYYRGYTIDADGVPAVQPLFDNASFLVSFGIVGAGLWTLNSAVPLYLFQTGGSVIGPAALPPDPATDVLATSQLAVPGIARQTPPPYYNPAEGALRLTLVAPTYAFGNALYASNLLAASSANAAATQVRTTNAAGVKAQVALAKSANATAPAKIYNSTVGAAVSNTVSALNSHAYKSLLQALPKDPATGKPVQRAIAALQAAISAPADATSWLDRLKGWWLPPGVASVTNALQDWMTAHEGALAAMAGALWPQAGAALADAEALAAAWSAVSGMNTAAARPTLAATLDQIGPGADAVTTPSGNAPLPNQPWLPTASSFSVSYLAAAHIALGPVTVATGTAQAHLANAWTQAGHSGRFLHLAPFDRITPANVPPAVPPAVAVTPAIANLAVVTSTAATSAPLIPQIEGAAAFYIELSAAVSDISLLFVLTAGPDGWSSRPSTLIWQKQVGTRWLPITAVSDTTNGLRNSGVVMLQIATSQEQYIDVASRLRAVLDDGDENCAYVASVTTNALIATWQGPGGAESLGQPLPAGTIKQSQSPIAGIGSIVQPMQSVGGAPPLTGQAFHLWMAERLRHKGFAIAAWDYARLVLAAIPSLWQVAVVPAFSEAAGRRAPGSVWLIAVAGPNTPNIVDTTAPTVDPGVIGEIGVLLAAITSPFATLTVTNPPYLRLTVQATLVFSGTDTPTFWMDRLQDELTAWLSPWPDPRLGDRPDDYYTRQAIAEFIRHRPYVDRITSLEIIPDRDPATTGWHYFTSALQHRLFAYTPPAAGAPDGGRRTVIAT